MASLDQIEKQVEQLPMAEKKALLQWLEDLLEDELEFTDEFKAKIERAKRDIAQGKGNHGRAPAQRRAFIHRISILISSSCLRRFSDRLSKN